MLLWSCRAFFDYGDLWARLHGKTFVERGRLGCDDSQCFLSRAGKVWLRVNDAKTRFLGLSPESQLSNPSKWAWIAKTERMLPADARIYLNIPDFPFYCYGTFLWYPREVSLNTRRVLINDSVMLHQNAVGVTPADAQQLHQAGYTHLVTGTPQGAAVIDLRALVGETKR